jgi:O-antigen ligase
MTIHIASADLRGLRAPRIGALPGGGLVWSATVAVTLVLAAASVGLHDGRVFLATGACALFGIVFAIRPAVGVAAIVVVRPSLDLWADRPLASIGSIQLNPASLMALMFIAIGGAYVIERWPDVRSAPVARPYLGLALMAVLSIAVAPSKGGAATEVLRLLSVVVLYLAAYAVIRDRRGLMRMTAALIISLAAPTVVALWQFAHGGSTVIGEIGRSTGTFLHPDPFGIFMGFMAAFLVPLAITRGVLHRGLVLVALPLAGLALLSSYTRTGWVGFLFGVAVLAVVRYRGLLVIGPLLLVLIAAAVPSTVQRFSDLNAGRTQYGPGNSLRARYDLWRQNLPRVAHNPVLGNGFKSIVEDTSGTAGPSAGGVNIVQGAHSHSDFVRAVVELGIPGLIFFTWLLFGSARACSRSLKRATAARDPALTALCLGALAATSTYVLMSFDSNLMTQVAVSGTLWTVAAVGHAAGRVETHGSTA